MELKVAKLKDLAKKYMVGLMVKIESPHKPKQIPKTSGTIELKRVKI